MRYRYVLLSYAAQVFLWAIFLHYFAESIPGKAHFLHRQAVAGIDHGEPVDLIVNAVVEDARARPTAFGVWK